MVFSVLLIIFLFLKSWGQLPILRSIQYVTFKYGDFKKASRITLHGPSISINSIEIFYNIDMGLLLCCFGWTLNDELVKKIEKTLVSGVCY